MKVSIRGEKMKMVHRLSTKGLPKKIKKAGKRIRRDFVLGGILSPTRALTHNVA
jgi:hypothetical protein